jgi:hypothetical protein
MRRGVRGEAHLKRAKKGRPVEKRFGSNSREGRSNRRRLSRADERINALSWRARDTSSRIETALREAYAALVMCRTGASPV